LDGTALLLIDRLALLLVHGGALLLIDSAALLPVDGGALLLIDGLALLLIHCGAFLQSENKNSNKTNQFHPYHDKTCTYVLLNITKFGVYQTKLPIL
jgi:hypothetical protein